jgi:hypothetical protein
LIVMSTQASSTIVKGINKKSSNWAVFLTKQRLLIKRYWTYISNFSVNYYNVINDDWLSWRFRRQCYVYPAGTPFNWNSPKSLV